MNRCKRCAEPLENNEVYCEECKEKINNE